MLPTTADPANPAASFFFDPANNLARTNPNPSSASAVRTEARYLRDPTSAKDHNVQAKRIHSGERSVKMKAQGSENKLTKVGWDMLLTASGPD
jgi:hypothetical protein